MLKLNTKRRNITLGLLSLVLALAPTLAWFSSSVFSAGPETPAVTTYHLTTATEDIRVFSQPANDLIFNPADEKLYASVPSSAGSGGNGVKPIDPRAGVPGNSVFVGSEPGKLALSADGRSLYVSLDGAFAVRRFDTVTQTAGPQFTTGFGTLSRHTVADMVVSPDDPNIVAVARIKAAFSPQGEGVAIFNNGTVLSQTTPGHIQGCDSIQFSPSGATLFGTGESSGLKKINVSGTGAVVATSSSTAMNTRIKYSGGKIFSSAGEVIDGTTNAVLGAFPTAKTKAFVPDAAVARAFYLAPDTTTPNTWTLKAFNIDTYALTGSLTISGVDGEADSLVRWGGNGLAFRTTGGQLFVLQTSLIPSGDPIPSPTVTPTPSVTPVSTPFSTRIASVPVYANNLAYNAANRKMYASVPSSMGAEGNRIATIDPASGILESSVFIGSEPNKLALSSDNQKLFVVLDGAREVREFNVADQTPGAQYSGGLGAQDGPWIITGIAASPDNPGQIAIARHSGASSAYGGDAVFDNGIARSASRGESDGIVYSDNSSTLYGLSDQAKLETMTVSATGITALTETFFDYGGHLVKYIAYSNGRVYNSDGRVLDPATREMVGTFDLGGGPSQNPMFVVDQEHNRIFFLMLGPSPEVRSFALDTFLPAGSIFLPSAVTPTDFKRWGINGLAIGQGSGPVVLINSTLVDPGEPVPVTTPTPVVTPTVTPVPPSVFYRKINQPGNDMALNPGDGKLYVSVPASATNGTANTITRISPQTGEALSSTSVGGEPGKIGMGDDGQTLYVALNAVSALRRFDMSTQTAGIQFQFGTAASYTFGDLGVVPGNPNVLVVSAGNGGTAVFENGIKRTTVFTSSVGPIEFSAPDTVFGYNNASTGYNLYKLGIGPSGLTSLRNTRNLISGFGNEDLEFAEGKIFTQGGRVVDPESNRITGTFPGAGNSIAVDTAERKVFIASSSGITVFDMDTYLKLGTIPNLNLGGTPLGLVRWGANGLAARVQPSSGPTFIILIQSGIVSASAPVPVGLNLDAAAYSVPESASSRLIGVYRTGEINTPVTVHYETADQTASAGTDYTATSGTLTFAPGEVVKSFSVPILDDNVFESGETFLVKLTGPTGTEVNLLSPSTSTVTLTDNDSRPAISNEDSMVNEGAAGNTSIANVTVRLTNPSTETVSVNYLTANGTALAGTDYTATSGTLTFAPLETVKTIPVTVLGDNAPEGSETFFLNLSGPVNGAVNGGHAVVTIIDFVLPHKAAYDFDGDGKSDVSVFRPSDGNWYLLQSTAGYTGTHFGIAADQLAPADYDGDGKTDIAVFRDGAWYLQQSTAGFLAYNFGQAGDIPQPADFNGDGKAELAVFRPSDGGWYKLDLNGYVFMAVSFGQNGDKPVVGDYDGDGKADPAVYRGGSWYILASTQGYYGVSFGIATDKPVPADYDGDGKTDQAVVRDGFWYLLRSTAGYTGFQWGNPTDLPVAADYDGDGKADVSVFREGFWYLQQTSAGYAGVSFGSTADKPVPNSFVP